MKTKLLSSLVLAAAPAAMFAQSQATETPDSTLSAPTYENLEEVVVSAKKPVVQSNGEKVSYNVDEDPSSASSSLLEMLRKVPAVTVDGQDNIQVNGQSNFKIYVNGKEDPMFSSNPGQILKSMPASSVVKIEVINEPGAKYDAEGTAGILNFVTVRKQRNEGYAGGVQASLSSESVQAGLSGRMRRGDLMASAHFEFADNHIHPQEQYNSNTTLYLDNPTDYRLESTTLQKFAFNYFGGGLDLSWEPDTLNLFTVNFSFNSMHAGIKKFDETSALFDREGSFIRGYHRIGDGGYMNTLGLRAGASYQHTFGPQGHHLIASYLYNRSTQKLNLTRRFVEMSGYTMPEWSDLLSDNSSNEHTAQIDYALPLGGEKHLVEVGLKGVFRRNYALGHDMTGDRPDDMTASVRTDVEQFQDIAAAYASYTGSYGPYGVKAGVRYEHTRMGMDFRAGDTPDFTTRLNDVVPNAAVSYSFSPAHSLRLAYQMRISRPTLNQVNPFQVKYSEYLVMTGNPDLGSERSNKITLTYSNFTRLIGGNISIEYAQINNAISRYTYVDDGIIYETEANLGKSQSTTLSGFLNYNITPRMRFTLNGRVEYLNLDAPNPLFGTRPGSPEKLKASGWTGNFGASFDYTMPWRLRLGAYGGKDWGRISLTSTRDGWYYYGMSLTRTFLKNDALSLTLGANNFFQKNRTFKGESWSEAMRNYSRYTSRCWSVSFSISWNFGNLRSNVRRTDADVQTDDRSSSGGGNNGGIL